MNNILTGFFRLLLAAMLLLSGSAACAGTAGHLQFVKGEVQRTTAAGKTHGVKKGDAVNEGDTLATAKNAYAQIKMLDGGLVAMRPESKLRFDSFKFSGKNDGSDQSFFSLIKGGFRAVTGLIGLVNKENYRISTPTSTIGIRGTDHEILVILPDSPLAAMAPPGSYDKVNVGATIMSTGKGAISVLPNQMGFAGGMDQMPQIQPVNTQLFSVTPAPAVQAKNDKKSGKKKGGAGGDGAQGGAQPQFPIRTADGTNLTGPSPRSTQGQAAPAPVVALPPKGLNGIAYFSAKSASSASWVYSGTADNTEDQNGLSAFTSKPAFTFSPTFASTVGGYSGARGTANTVDAGTIALVGTESMGWGRWSGDGATVTQTGTTVPTKVFSLHYVVGSPVPQMPITGTANYVPVGGTRPTDSLGNAGQFTGATVQADFARKNLNVEINLSFGGSTFAAQGKGIFGKNGVIPVTMFTTVNCAPNCFATGRFAGAFAGTNANGLGLAYHVYNIGSGQAINGVQAFKRQ